MAKNVRQVITAPVTEHSEKPELFAQAIEKLVEGPYIEVFSRKLRPNWTVWGKDVPQNTLRKYMHHEPDGKAEVLHTSIDAVRFRDGAPILRMNDESSGSEA